MRLVERVERILNLLGDAEARAQLVSLQDHLIDRPVRGGVEPKSATWAQRHLQRRLDRAEVDALVSEYEVGSTIDELAERFDIHRTTVMSHLDRRRIPRRRAGLDPGDLPEVVKLYRAGLGAPQIGEKFGVDARTVRRRLVEAGVALRRGGRPRRTG